MSSAFAPCSEPGQSEILAVLYQRVATLEGLPERLAALEARLARKRPDTGGRRMTRLDRCPYGFRPHPKNPARLIEDPQEQRVIQALVELAQVPVGVRELCRRLDAAGYRRRNGGAWGGSHSLVTSILKRHSAETPAAAKLRVLERIAAAQARAADR